MLCDGNRQLTFSADIRLIAIVDDVNMARYFSSLRALLVVLRNCDPLLYQYVDGGGFFTSHGQPNKQVPPQDYAFLQERGVAAIYGPGTPMLDSVRDVLNLISG